MKKIFGFAWLASALLLLACGNDKSSPTENTPDDISSSSVVVVSSSSGARPVCPQGMLFSSIWPVSLAGSSTLKNFAASGNNLDYDCEIMISEASLYKMFGPDSGKLVGSVPVSKELLSETAGSRWKFTCDFSGLDEPTPLADGSYMVVWVDGELKTSFHLYRNFPDVELGIYWSDYNKDLHPYVYFPNFYNNPDIYERGFIYNPASEKTYALEKGQGFTGQYHHYKLENILDSVEDGRFVFHWESFVNRTASNGELYNMMLYGRSDDAASIWPLVLDSAGHFTDDVTGKILEKEFWIDRSAPKILDVLKKEYSIKTDGSVKQISFDVKLKVYDALLGRKSNRIKASYYSQGQLVTRDYFDAENDTTELSIKFDVKNSKKVSFYLKVLLEDEFSNRDSIYFDKMDVVDSLFVKDGLAWTPAIIPSKLYDCTKYECVSTAYLNPDLEYGEFLDERDNKVYRTIQIGEQTWMAQNLNFKIDSSFCYKDSQDSCKKYGRLYTWNASVGISLETCPYAKKCVVRTADNMNEIFQGVCPDGWRVPSFDDVYRLNAYVDEKFDSRGLTGARFMKATEGWSNGFGSNETGLSVIAVPLYERESGFQERDSSPFWLADGYLTSRVDERFPLQSYNDNLAVIYHYQAFSDVAEYDVYAKDFGLPVRCLKN